MLYNHRKNLRLAQAVLQLLTHLNRELVQTTCAFNWPANRPTKRPECRPLYTRKRRNKRLKTVNIGIYIASCPARLG